MQEAWAITPEKIAVAVRQIVNVAHPRKVIVFGSVVSGTPDIHSDVDILVVMGDEIQSQRAESVRIRRALRGITMPMDILVISEKCLQEVADQPGLVYQEAVQHGRIVYEAEG